METRFKLGDTRYPEENETHYFNGRYQNKIRNGTRSYYSDKIDPLSYKISSWREYGRDTKIMAKRAARHNAKILVRLEALSIMDELWQDLMEMMWEEYNNEYYEDMVGFDFSYSDEAYDYAEQRRQEELILDYDYDPYMDWDF